MTNTTNMLIRYWLEKNGYFEANFENIPETEKTKNKACNFNVKCLLGITRNNFLNDVLRRIVHTDVHTTNIFTHHT